MWRRLGATAIPDISPLLRCLAEPQRHNHTLAHIRHCLAVYDRGPATDDAVELALWMHDAMYEPQQPGNEERSASWCRVMATSAGIPEATLSRTERCILATRHRHDADRADERLTVSIDLNILGETTERFSSYVTAIRREYAFVPAALYRREHAKVLTSFLMRQPLFPHSWWDSRYGHQGRTNIWRALYALL